MRRLISIYDRSGHWPYYYFQNGWDVINWDIYFNLDINIIKDAETALDLFEDVHGILAAPPCTDFTISGAQYWKQKDEDGRTQNSLEFVYQVQRLASLFTPTDPDYPYNFFWAVENPVGRLPKLIPDLGKPMYFQPWEYAGWLNLSDNDLFELDRIRKKDGKGITKREALHIINCNAYTKKTGLWGEFNHNLKKKPIEPVKGSPQGSPFQRFGGKSDKTKSIRSQTPLGFSKAFYNANSSLYKEEELIF
jgi:hypothetical protein